jgi:5-methyltetrahydrofolate--homocysteine methyltransferase
LVERRIVVPDVEGSNPSTHPKQRGEILVVLTDGAWGTQLQARGLGLGECGDLWTLTRPAEVEAVARSYVEAGSEIILTNTFRANRMALAAYGAAEMVGAVNRAGAAISRRAAGGRVRVFGSMGPGGNREDVLEQARALLEGGVDGLVIETMTDLEEARVALAAARLVGLPVPGFPVVASMVFGVGGVTPEEAARELTAAGADVIGANCGAGIAGYASICRRLRAATDRPIWIKPSAGLPEMVDGTAVYRMTPPEFARCVPELVKAGAQYVGGCCGTGPEFIRAVRRILTGLAGKQLP